MPEAFEARQAIAMVAAQFSDRSMKEIVNERPLRDGYSQGRAGVAFFLEYVLPEASPEVQRAFVDAIERWHAIKGA